MVYAKINEPSAFLKYMLVQEADDEEELPKNRKVIKLKASDGRRTSYTKDAEITLDDEEDNTTDDNTDDGGEGTDEPAVDDTDYTDGDDPDTNDAEDDFGDDADSDEPMMDDTDYMGDGDDNTDDTGDDGGEGTDEPVMDDTDYTGDGGEDDSTNDTEDSGTSDDTNNNSNGNSNANKDEQARKYVLYRKFMELDKLLEHYSDVLNSSMSDDISINQKYKRIANNLKKLNDLISEYMIIKFQSASYIQSMLFYQRAITTIDININVLGDIKKELAKTGIK